MLKPSNVSVNQREERADREKWAVGAVTQFSPSVTRVENDKLASVAKHEYNYRAKNTPLSCRA